MTAKDSKRKRHINERMRTDYFPEYKVGIPLTEEERRFREEGGPVITYRIEDLEGKK